MKVVGVQVPSPAPFCSAKATQNKPCCFQRGLFCVKENAQNVLRSFSEAGLPKILNIRTSNIMAQVKEVSKQGLKREYAITVPKDVLEGNITAQLEEVQKTARFPGFRPGKAPLDLIRKQHGQSVRAETLDKTISEAVQKTLSERNLRPAMQPKIELVSFAEDKDLEFTLAVEILPDITPGDFSKIGLELLTTEVEDKVVDDAIGRAAKAIREPELVT